MKKLVAGKRTFIIAISVAIVLVIAVLASLFIFSPNKTVGTLHISEQDWSGWVDPTNSPQQESKTISQTPRNGDTIDIGGPTLRVVNVSGDSVRLQINGLSLKAGADLEKSGINLNGCTQQDFVLQRGERAELSTCTTDSGTTWKLHYE